jgi:hypothetical protein
MAARDNIHGHEADIVPVPRHSWFRVAEADP